MEENKNIGNIIGYVFDQEIGEQINKRQELLSKKQKSNDEILWLNANSPWIRMCSSVDVEGSSNLAKDNILFGGTATKEGGIKRGFDQTYKYNENLGYRPMAGIESVNISTLTRGSLKKAEVNIKAYSIEDFEIIDKLYMRPGYTVLLEWGHSKYVDNEGVFRDFTDWNTGPFEHMLDPSVSSPYDIGFDPNSMPQIPSTQVTDPNLIRFKYFTPNSLSTNPRTPNFNLGSFNKQTIGIFNYEQSLYNIMFDKIDQEKRKYHGNYGAFFGRIVNFNWSFKDNVYSIRVELISIGDVIESLKIGQASYNETELPQTEEGGIDTAPYYIKYRDENRFYEFLFNIYSVYNKIKPKNKLNASLPWNLYHWDLYQNVESKDPIREIQKQIPTFNETTDIWNLNILEDEYTYEVQSRNRRGKTKTVTYSGKFNNLYIRLETLLRYLEKTNNIFTDDKQNSLISIDYSDNNFCFANLTLSEANKKDYGILDNAWTTSVINSPKFHFDSNISLNPGVFIIKSPKINGFENKKDFVYERSLIPYAGNPLNIYLNIDYLSRTFDEIHNSEESSLYNFIKKVLNDIDKGFGGLTNLDFRKQDPDKNKFIIQDYNNIIYNDPEAKKDPYKFNIYGLGSFVENPSFNVNLPKQFASMVTIGAQANQNVLEKDATSFATYNQGLKDRILPDKVTDPNEIIGDGYKDKFKKLYIKFLNLREKIYNSPEETKSDNPESLIDSFINTGRDLYSMLVGNKVKNKELPSPFFLPFKLNLKMLGLSGMKIYERFGITPNSSYILPSTYRDNSGNPILEFIIEGVDEQIDKSKWTTSINAISIPIRNQEYNMDKSDYYVFDNTASTTAASGDYELINPIRPPENYVFKSPLGGVSLNTRSDSAGDGNFNARRSSGSGKRPHRGWDVLANPNWAIFSPIDGTVFRRNNFSRGLQAIQIVGRNEYKDFTILLGYSKLELRNGSRINRGERVGYMEDLLDGYNNSSMRNHLHIQVYYKGQLANPQTLTWM